MDIKYLRPRNTAGKLQSHAYRQRRPGIEPPLCRPSCGPFPGTAPRTSPQRRRTPAQSQTAPRESRSLGGWRPPRFPEREPEQTVHFCSNGTGGSSQPEHLTRRQSEPGRKRAAEPTAAILDRVGHLWITKYHLLLNTSKIRITGCPVVTGACPGRPGETGTHEASGCSPMTKTGLTLVQNKAFFSSEEFHI